MTAAAGRYAAAIPGEYKGSPYPLVYFFELRDGAGHACFHPGFEADLSNQPYFVVRSST